MKIGKFEFTKKTVTTVEVLTILIALSALSIYYAPRFINKQETMAAAKIKADNAVFISKSLEEFAQDKDAKPSEIAQRVSDELNIVTVNPYNKKLSAYTFEKECKACNSIEYDDAQEVIILTSYDKKGELIARTVIKPPSFVTYNKD